MTATGVRVVGLLALAVTLAVPAAGAEAIAQLTWIDGATTVQRAYVSSFAYAGTRLADSDEVRTTTGRAEIAFPDGSVLHLDRDTRVAVLARERFVVIDGRVFFRSSAFSPMGYQAQTDVGRVRVLPRGVIGILADQKNRQVLLSVAVGEVQVESSWGQTRILSREMALVSGATGRPYVTPFEPWRGDGFELWSSSRVLDATLSPSPLWQPSTLEAVPPGVDYYSEPVGYYSESSIYTPGWVGYQPWYPYDRPHVRHHDNNQDYRRREPPPSADYRHFVPPLYPINQYAPRSEPPAPNARPRGTMRPPTAERPSPPTPAPNPPVITNAVPAARSSQPRVRP